MPTLMVAKGRVMLPGEDGPEIARGPDEAPLDLFDVADHLASRYPRTYVVDLDGIESNRPQLDYLQELARETDVWVDAGVRTGDQAIDVLVTGARRAVLSTARLRSPKELRRAWNLSQDLVFEVEVRGPSPLPGAGEWAGPPASIAAAVREVGVTDLVLSYREGSIDWSAVRGLAAGGPVWVDGVFERADAPQLVAAGAAGGIFHIHDEIRAFVEAHYALRDGPAGDATGPRPDDEKRTS